MILMDFLDLNIWARRPGSTTPFVNTGTTPMARNPDRSTGSARAARAGSELLRLQQRSRELQQEATDLASATAQCVEELLHHAEELRMEVQSPRISSPSVERCRERADRERCPSGQKPWRSDGRSGRSFAHALPFADWPRSSCLSSSSRLGLSSSSPVWRFEDFIRQQRAQADLLAASDESSMQLEEALVRAQRAIEETNCAPSTHRYLQSSLQILEAMVKAEARRRALLTL